MTTKDFGMGFFGRRPFGEDMRTKFREEWSKMTDSEKVEFVNKKMDFMDKHEDHFSVEAIDARCEAWLKMTPEEKQQFVAEKKQAFHERMACMGRGFGHHHGHHFERM